MSVYNKRDVVLEMLKFGSVQLLVSPKMPGVTVPEEHRNTIPLGLDIGYKMAVPMPDLDISDRGIGVTLSFNRRSEWCFVPWAAVAGITQDGALQILWSPSVPMGKPKPTRPTLSLVK